MNDSPSSGQERSYYLCPRNCPFVAQWTRKIADVRNEALDHRIECSILQRRDDDRAGSIREIDGQHLDRPPIRVEARDRAWKGGDETAGSEQPVRR